MLVPRYAVSIPVPLSINRLSSVPAPLYSSFQLILPLLSIVRIMSTGSFLPPDSPDMENSILLVVPQVIGSGLIVEEN